MIQLVSKESQVLRRGNQYFKTVIQQNIGIIFAQFILDPIPECTDQHCALIVAPTQTFRSRMMAFFIITILPIRLINFFKENIKNR